MKSYRINPALCQQIAFTNGASVQSTAILADEVILYSTKDCFINMSASPTAGSTGAGSIFIPAQTFFELAIPQRSYLLAARGSTDSGTLYINAKLAS